MRRIFCALLAALLLLTACGGKQDDAAGEGYVPGGDWGYPGDVMHTCWFDFTVTDAHLGGLGSLSPAPGKQLVTVSVTLRSTFPRKISMSRLDFQLQWGGEEEGDYAWPLAAAEKEQLPDSYTLKQGEERSGLLVFEVPEGTASFSLSFMEYFEGEDDRQGDPYFIYFTADAAAAAPQVPN